MKTSHESRDPLYNEKLSINSRIDTFLKLKTRHQNEEISVLMEDLDKLIHTQFLMDVWEIYGEETFKTITSSAKNGNDCYLETLSRLVPKHQEMFSASRSKVICCEKFQMLQKINDSQHEGVIMTAFRYWWFFVPFGICCYKFFEWLKV